MFETERLQEQEAKRREAEEKGQHIQQVIVRIKRIFDNRFVNITSFLQKNNQEMEERRRREFFESQQEIERKKQEIEEAKREEIKQKRLEEIAKEEKRKQVEGEILRY
jgi:hypothetical protein